MTILKSVQGLKNKCELLKEEENITPATIICYLTCITGKKKNCCVTEGSKALIKTDILKVY